MTDGTTSRDIEALERAYRARTSTAFKEDDDPAELPPITPGQRTADTEEE